MRAGARAFLLINIVTGFSPDYARSLASGTGEGDSTDLHWNISPTGLGLEEERIRARLGTAVSLHAGFCCRRIIEALGP